MDLIPQIRDEQAALAAIRQDIHAHPEIGFQETRTAALVADCLRRWGVDQVETGIGKTGVVGVIEGRGPGRTVGLRADMDALPMEEDTGLPFTSRNPGAFHGCGHDGHTTMLLGAAQYLAASRSFPGRVILIFQPAEERLTGADAMIADGLFDRFPCDEVYGLHNWPGKPAGWIGCTPGVSMAASNSFDIAITGRGSHGAMPNQSVDPVIVAVSLAQALQTVVSRNVPPRQMAVLSVTSVHAGSAYNVVPEAASLCGTIRSYDKAVHTLIIRRIQEITAGIAATFGATATVTINPGCTPLANDPALADIACRIASELVGAENVDPAAEPVSGSEDFAAMLEKVPGAYLWVGAGDGKNLHNPGYRFNDDILPIGASLLARIAERRLAGNQ
ncbi:M20 aminoacylase family protein [Rhodopila sp.]|jgi:hippurate hydrolase|uniref:M20 aminoacylase family protein n=1 Tax=Rhodopila sp. TaxID=2480087 RepID=UPI002D0BC345|nr:M20 aminoacylase family protein [Rhodopila sp.]HVZ07465.1 M20 aminoacylase family protein [Rhodopila sp.]